MWLEIQWNSAEFKKQNLNFVVIRLVLYYFVCFSPFDTGSVVGMEQKLLTSVAEQRTLHNLLSFMDNILSAVYPEAEERV